MKVVIVGAGAAGLMAAAHLSMWGHVPEIVDSNGVAGVKLLITGKGRCNLTNHCSIEDFQKNVTDNPKFLFSAFKSFDNAMLMEYFQEIGVKLKVERGGRVFPVSDKSSEIVNALKKAVGVPVKKARITAISDNCLLTTGGRSIAFDKVLIATGGKSYPKTGSKGDGYELAKQIGHTIVPLSPGLVPLETSDNYDLDGLSLRNVNFSVYQDKKVYSGFGEMIFTHFGVSGPLVLTASNYLKSGPAQGYIDLKPALSEEQLNKRLLSDFDKYKNKDFKNALFDLLPRRLIDCFISLSQIDGDTKVNSITKAQRRTLIKLFKDFPVNITKMRPIEEAVITRGGVSTKEINPRTMQSTLKDNVFFAGEIIDVAALTGGYNLQIAFSTGYLAAKGILDK